MLATFSLSLHAAPAEIWVAPNGDDRAAGTREQPLASVAMAQRKARELRRTGNPSIGEGVRIRLRGGMYSLSSPLLWRWEDSGTSASPTVVESADGERATLSGGMAVRGWTKLPSKMEAFVGAPSYERLSAAARAQVWVADAPSVAGRPLELRELWIGDRKATRARTPNDPDMQRLSGWDRQAEVATIPAAALCGIERPDAVEMVIEQQWEIAILRLRGIERAGDQARLTFQSPESAIEFQHPWPQPILPPKGGGAFFLVNAIEFLDSPGEWYQDRATGRIYYWPRPDEDLTRDTATVPFLTMLVEVRGSLDRPVAHIHFRNVAFAHGAWREPGESGHVPLQGGMAMVEAYKLSVPGTPDKKSLENQAWIARMPSAVVVSAAHDVAFERCRFEHVAAAALDFGVGAHDSSAIGCMFRDVGGNGIQLGSFQEGGVETHVPYAPSDDREVCARIRIANNVLRDTANTDWGCVAIIAGYARELAIEHNDIADTSYTGISVGWGWTKTANASRDNRIHANSIRHIATRVCDTAGVYTLSAQPGTTVSENLIDDVAMNRYVDRPEHWFYLYTDEGSSNVTVRDNWCPSEKFLKNANGPGNVWDNNGSMVSDDIKRRAGLEPAFQDLLKKAEENRDGGETSRRFISRPRQNQW